MQTTKNLKGLSGWLMFFLICFALTGLAMLSASIYCIFTPLNAASSIVTAIFTPFVAACALLSVVFIALQLKIARILAIATYAVAAAYGSIAVLIAIGETKIINNAGAVWAGAIIGIITSLVVYGLLALYFIVSKRVKETLVKDLPKNIGLIVFSAAGGVALILAILGIIFSATSKNTVSSPSLDSDHDYDYSYNEDEDETNAEQPNIETKTINKTITDPELGYTVTAKQVIFNVPFDESDGYDQAAYKKSLAVEVTVANNSEYYNSFSSSDLELTINGQSQYHGDYEFSEYISANSLTKLPMSTSQGNSSTGWIFFSYDKDLTGTISLTYDRSAATTTDGKTIPAKKFNIDLN